jgi:hypothetical protein
LLFIWELGAYHPLVDPSLEATWLADPEPRRGVEIAPNWLLATLPEEVDEETMVPALATPTTKSVRAVYFIFF